MSKDELKEKIEEWGIEDGTIILEPQEDFNFGIIGVTEDKRHLVYSYTKLTEGMAQKEFENSAGGMTLEECFQEACEWVDYNTIRSLPYMNEDYRPIFIYEF